MNHMNDTEFWAIVETANWSKDFDSERICNWMCQTMRWKKIVEFRTIAAKKWMELDRLCGDRNPAGGGDDSHSDLLYHVIGLGKEVYEANLADYMLLAFRGNSPYGSKEGYKECFVYAIPHQDSYDEFNDPDHFSNWAKRAQNDIGAMLEKDTNDSLKQVHSSFVVVDEALDSVISGDLDSFIRLSFTIEKELKKVNKFFTDNYMELPRKFTDNGFKGYNIHNVKNLLSDIKRRNSCGHCREGLK
jgi:hypothetical protein